MTDERNEKDIVLDEILRTYPERVESPLNTHLRCQSFKDFVRDYIAQNCSSDASQVAVVGHSQYFSYLTATRWPLLESIEEDSEGPCGPIGYDYTQAPLEYRFLSNCEFYPLDRHLVEDSDRV